MRDSHILNTYSVCDGTRVNVSVYFSEMVLHIRKNVNGIVQDLSIIYIYGATTSTAMETTLAPHVQHGNWIRNFVITNHLHFVSICGTNERSIANNK